MIARRALCVPAARFHHPEGGRPQGSTHPLHSTLAPTHADGFFLKVDVYVVLGALQATQLPRRA